MFELDCRSEGEDKPVKYPGIFHRSSLLILTKTDLLPHVEFDPKLALENGRKVHPEIEYIALLSRTGEGFPEWMGWLKGLQEKVRGEGVRRWFRDWLQLI